MVKVRDSSSRKEVSRTSYERRTKRLTRFGLPLSYSEVPSRSENVQYQRACDWRCGYEGMQWRHRYPQTSSGMYERSHAADTSDSSGLISLNPYQISKEQASSSSSYPHTSLLYDASLFLPDRSFPSQCFLRTDKGQRDDAKMMPGNYSPASPTAASSPHHQHLTGAFASLEERIAHLQWRKTCNERDIQGTLRLTKQLQERDDFRRVAKQCGAQKEKVEWMQSVISDELHKPLPVTPAFLHDLEQQEHGLDRLWDDATTRHRTQIKQIQSKLDDREAGLVRKKEFERKKKELFRG